jgi:hypothetical protein
MGKLANSLWVMIPSVFMFFSKTKVQFIFKAYSLHFS